MSRWVLIVLWAPLSPLQPCIDHGLLMRMVIAQDSAWEAFILTPVAQMSPDMAQWKSGPNFL